MTVPRPGPRVGGTVAAALVLLLLPGCSTSPHIEPASETMSLYGLTADDGPDRAFRLRAFQDSQTVYEGEFVLPAGEFRFLTALGPFERPLRIEVDSGSDRVEHPITSGQCQGAGVLVTIRFDGEGAAFQDDCNEEMELY